MDYDDRIDKTIDRTDSATLRCANHPNLRWHTKNISYIGARSIFPMGEIVEPFQKKVREYPLMSTNDPNYKYEGQRNYHADPTITYEISSFKPSHPTLGAFNPRNYLKARLNNKNPYNTDLDAPGGNDSKSDMTWEEVVQFVNEVEKLREQYAIDCGCSIRDLELVPKDQTGYIPPSKVDADADADAAVKTDTDTNTKE